MNESDVRLAVTHALQWHGYWPFHHQDGRLHFCKHGHPVLATPEIKGRPDIEARHPKHPTVFIEVKAITKDAKSFAFSQIEPEQREYLSNWTNEGGSAYLAIGKIVPHGTKSKIGSIWVFPWPYWLEVESQYQKSIAFSWGLYEKRPLDWQTRGSIRELRPIFEMMKTKEEDWQFFPSHWLAKPKKVAIPFYRKEKIRDDISKSIQVPVTDQPTDSAGLVH